MRLFLVTALMMTAFAANSVLNRMALVDAGMGPASFALIRLASGAVALTLLVAMARRGLPLLRPSLWGTAALATYGIGFSFAYVSLEAGVGALILFGTVQITMFLGAVFARETVPLTRILGALIAFAGLVYLLWPGRAAALDPAGIALMIVAAVGWGLYSLAGRGAVDPLALTAANFALAAPLALLVWILWRDDVTGAGVGLAVMSGVLTSGLGYALWYAVLPQLGAARAAVAQLTVPVIAVAGGALLLGEPVTLTVVLAGLLVLTGVALAAKG